jgi:hypothetical protein
MSGSRVEWERWGVGVHWGVSGSCEFGPAGFRRRGTFIAGFAIDDLDASVLLLPEIGLLETHEEAGRRFAVPTPEHQSSCISGD